MYSAIFGFEILLLCVVMICSPLCQYCLFRPTFFLSHFKTPLIEHIKKFVGGPKTIHCTGIYIYSVKEFISRSSS